MEKVGLIAGNGELPILFAKALKEHNLSVTAVAHRGETLDRLEEYVDRIFWIDIGQLQRIIEVFKDEGISNAVMAGGIPKTLMFSGMKPDSRASSLLSRLEHKKDDLLLRSLAAELEKEGINIKSTTYYLSSILAQKGCLTKKVPTDDEQKDIRFGWDIAKGIGKLDIGQTVVVKEQVILAVEAIEGTDAAIKRGGRLGGGQVVVVKVSKPDQDMRLDIPVVGVETIRSLKEAKASVLAIEAGGTIILNKEEMVKFADQEGISIVAI
ncbi:MAG: UDP-2,3-diacylglucosamine diphosphatase LpxI [Pseudomonadota bacterium]